MRRAFLVTAALAAIVPLSACASSEEPPEATVKGFFAQSLAKGDTTEDYLKEIKPYMTESAFRASRKSLDTQLNGDTSIKYSAVAIKDVAKIDDTTATVAVAYKVAYSYKGQSEEKSKVDTVTLRKVDSKWLLSA